MTSARHPGVTPAGYDHLGKAVPNGVVQINDCTRDVAQQIGVLSSKLTLVPTAGQDTFHIYFDEPIEVENVSLEHSKIYQLWYWTPQGDLLAAGDPFSLPPRQKRAMANPHIL